MLISISDAASQLDHLVAEAEAGGEVVLTRQGRPAVRLTMIPSPIEIAARRHVLDAARAQAGATARAGESAARSQDFLYADDGIPG